MGGTKFNIIKLILRINLIGLNLVPAMSTAENFGLNFLDWRSPNCSMWTNEKQKTLTFLDEQNSYKTLLKWLVYGFFRWKKFSFFQIIPRTLFRRRLNAAKKSWEEFALKRQQQRTSEDVWMTTCATNSQVCVSKKPLISSMDRLKRPEIA